MIFWRKIVPVYIMALYECYEKSDTLSDHVHSSTNGNKTNLQDYEAPMRWVICVICIQWSIIQMVAAIIIFTQGLTDN